MNKKRMDIHTTYSELEKENSQLKNQIRDIRMELEGIQKKYQLRYQNVPIPYVTMNCHGDILEFNHAACVFFGRKADRLCMDNLMEFLDADSRGQMGLFLQMVTEERLRKQLEVSELEVNFFVRGRRCETLVYYSFLFEELEMSIELAIWDISKVNEATRQLKKEYECYQIALQTSADYIFEYNQDTDELREYGDFKRPDIPKTERIIKKNFLQEVKEQQREKTDSYERMRDIFLGKTMSGELNLSEIDYYNFNGWAYLEIASFGNVFSESRVLGRIRDITEQKVKEFKKKETMYRDQLTGLYHSEYGLQVLEKKLESGKAQGVPQHLLLLTMDMTSQMEHHYGLEVCKGFLYIMGHIIKQEKERFLAIRTGNREMLLLLEDCSKEEATELTNRILEQLHKQYCGNEKYGKVTYTAMLWLELAWSGYVDWESFIQDMYEHRRGTENGSCQKEGAIPEAFCKEIPIKMQSYLGTSKIYDMEQKPIFSYMYDLFYKTMDMEVAILCILNIIVLLKQLRGIAIYDYSLEQQYECRYAWNLDREQFLHQVSKRKELWNEEECYHSDSDQIYYMSTISEKKKRIIFYQWLEEKNSYDEEEQNFFNDLSKIVLLALQHDEKKGVIEKKQHSTKKLKEVVEQLRHYTEETKQKELDVASLLKKIEQSANQLEEMIELL